MQWNKISLMDAYMIETLRKNGVSDQELIQQIEEKDIEVWDSIHTNFDFKELVRLEEQLGKDGFQQVLKEGYSIKFVTFNGLKSLLKLKFDKIGTRDYELKDNGIFGLRIEENQRLQLEKMLSGNWTIELAGRDNKESNYVFIHIFLANSLIGNL